jgi:ABC-type sugar transport system substrate-binding protein
MITHGEGKDPFWPVVQKGGEDAARAIGADFEYIYNPSADMLIWQAQFKLLQLLNQMVW